MISYKAKHILLEDLEDALEVREMILSGSLFEDMALEYSECSTGIFNKLVDFRTKK